MALPLALFVLSVLVTLILGFDADARRDLEEAAVFRDGYKAAALTRSAIQTARATLRRDVVLKIQAGRSYYALTDVWATPTSGKLIGDGIVSVSIEDERGKLNLNDLSRGWNPTLCTETILRFKRLCVRIQANPSSSTPSSIGSTLTMFRKSTWRGKRRYYESLNPPYQPANTALQTLDQLHLVKDMSPEIVERLAHYVHGISRCPRWMGQYQYGNILLSSKS